MSPNLLFSVVLVAASLGHQYENFLWTSGYCRQDGDADAEVLTTASSLGHGTDEWCAARCNEDPSCVAWDNCGNNCWLHGAPRSTGVAGAGCECWVKNDHAATTCPTCDGWCSCQNCAGPVNSCDWDCDESRSEPTWGGSRSDCWDDDGSGGGGSSMWVVGMIGGVLGVAVIVAVCVCVYCYVRYLRAKAAAAPPPMVEVQVLGTVTGAVESSGPFKGAPHADPVPSAPPAAMMPPPAPPRNFCSACGAPVQGPFCGQCGARA